MEVIRKRNTRYLKELIGLRISLEDKMVKKLILVAQQEGFEPARTAISGAWKSTINADDVFNVVFRAAESIVEFRNSERGEVFTCHIVRESNGYDCLVAYAADDAISSYINEQITEPLLRYAKDLERAL